MEQWYYSIQGKDPAGPVNTEDLKKLIAGGKLSGNDQVWNATINEWKPVGKVPELAAPSTAIKEPAKGPAPAVKKQPVVEPRKEPAKEAAREPVPEATPTAARRGGDAGGGFISTLHGALPKPVLFGIYGALGGLLGALVVGELIWQLTSPSDESTFKIATAPEITVYPGTSNTLKVIVARRGVSGPIVLRAVNPPSGVEISSAKIPEDKDEAELTITASKEAETKPRHDLQLRGVLGGSLEVVQSLKLKVVDPPPVVQLSTPTSVTVYAGDKNKFGFQTARDRFEGPARLEVLDLPKGVSIPLIVLNEKTSGGFLEVSTSKDVVPGPYPLTVKIHALANHKISDEKTIQLKVEPPPPKLQISVPKELTLFPGDSNKFTVKIGRTEFALPVEVYVPRNSLPADVEIAPVIISAKESDAELVVTAGKSYASKPASVHKLTVMAEVVDDRVVSTQKTMDLKIEPPPPTLQLAFSPKVSVYAGQKATFNAKIARYRFDGPVKLDLEGKAKFVQMASVTIPAGQTEAELEIAVDPAALNSPLPKTQPVQVVATFADKRRAVGSVQLEALAPPSDLKISVSPEVELYQGGRCRFSVKVARAGFLGPVTVNFKGLPANVFIPPAVLAAGVNDAVVDGLARLSAPVGKHKVVAVGTAAKAADGKIPTDTVEFTLDVKPVDPSKRPPPLDIVFLLDVSNSMDPQIAGVRDGVQQFIAELTKNELEARIGLVAFRDINFSDFEPMKTLDFNGEPFTADTKAFSVEVGKLKANGGGDVPESSLDALATAAKLPFRDNSYRIFLLITDAPPQKVGNSVTMKEALKFLKEKKIDQVHLIVNNEDRKEYQELNTVSRGSFFNLKEQAKNFASLLPVLSTEIANFSVAGGADTPLAKAPPALPVAKEVPSVASAEAPPPAAEKPPVPPPAPKTEAPVSTVAKELTPETVNALPAPRVTPPSGGSITGVQSTRGFAQEDAFQLLVAVALWTAALAAGISLTLVTGQKLYLQKTWPRLSEIGKVLTAGLAAGLLAGVLSQYVLLLGQGVGSGEQASSETQPEGK